MEINFENIPEVEIENIPEVKIKRTRTRTKKPKVEVEKEKKPRGRPHGTIKECSIYHMTKPHILPTLREYPLQHINRMMRYKIEYDDSIYIFSTIDQIQKQFNLSYGITCKLLSIFQKKTRNEPLSSYDIKLLDTYPKMTNFEKLPLDHTKRITHVIIQPKENDLNLKISVPTM